MPHPLVHNVIPIVYSHRSDILVRLERVINPPTNKKKKISLSRLSISSDLSSQDGEVLESPLSSASSSSTLSRFNSVNSINSLLSPPPRTNSPLSSEPIIGSDNKATSDTNSSANNGDKKNGKKSVIRSLIDSQQSFESVEKFFEDNIKEALKDRKKVGLSVEFNATFPGKDPKPGDSEYPEAKQVTPMLKRLFEKFHLSPNDVAYLIFTGKGTQGDSKENPIKKDMEDVWLKLDYNVLSIDNLSQAFSRKALSKLRLTTHEASSTSPDASDSATSHSSTQSSPETAERPNLPPLNIFSPSPKSALSSSRNTEDDLAMSGLTSARSFGNGKT